MNAYVSLRSLKDEESLDGPWQFTVAFQGWREAIVQPKTVQRTLPTASHPSRTSLEIGDSYQTYVMVLRIRNADTGAIAKVMQWMSDSDVDHHFLRVWDFETSVNPAKDNYNHTMAIVNDWDPQYLAPVLYAGEYCRLIPLELQAQ